ncbi:unnamed protein product [Citrullus colocynthis]|uniref:Uncharacterized protein n=1 Tax=Citrullus colocynthis TaxID=252529 RepID=A0ABP0YYC5_9ROSI
MPAPLTLTWTVVTASKVLQPSLCFSLSNPQFDLLIRSLITKFISQQKFQVVSKESAFTDEKDLATPQAMDDRLKYRPNPDMLISKTEEAAEDGDGIYRPPKFAPTSMEEDKKSRKERSNSWRKDLETLRRVRQSDYMMELMDDMAGTPEEKSRYGMGGVTDSFYEEVKSLPLKGADAEQPTDFGNGSGRMRQHKKRKVCHIGL